MLHVRMFDFSEIFETIIGKKFGHIWNKFGNPNFFRNGFDRREPSLSPLRLLHGAPLIRIQNP